MKSKFIQSLFEPLVKLNVEISAQAGSLIQDSLDQKLPGHRVRVAPASGDINTRLIPDWVIIRLISVSRALSNWLLVALATVKPIANRYFVQPYQNLRFKVGYFNERGIIRSMVMPDRFGMFD
ncbi:MAG TPA: hypothetical protein DES72_04200 [Gammaproteobacteria bacterium]|nr:hypothetical protein [Gammaproteobacteria bacterium]|tara:strand:- start:234 stop:602 length:369 start_codon:yes stop_codon:yes gene_type:complete